MLGKPHAGWSDFQIDDEHTYSLSYLNDVALEWLDQAIHGLTTLEPFAVHGFCEPDRMVCTVSYWNCYVVFESDGMFNPNSYNHMYEVGLNMIDFCKTLYSDVQNNIDDWVHWDDSSLRDVAEDKYCDEHPEEDAYNEQELDAAIMKEFDSRKKQIQDKLDCLKKLIDENEEHFGPHRAFF